MKKIIFGKIGHDKGLHLTAGFLMLIVAIAIVAIARHYGIGIPMWTACLLPVAVGLWKEVRDYYGAGTPEILDYLFTILPALIAFPFLS